MLENSSKQLVILYGLESNNFGKSSIFGSFLCRLTIVTSRAAQGASRLCRLRVVIFIMFRTTFFPPRFPRYLNMPYSFNLEMMLEFN